MQRVYLSFGNDSSAADTLGWLNSSLMLSLKVDREKSMTDQKQMHAAHKTNRRNCALIAKILFSNAEEVEEKETSRRIFPEKMRLICESTRK